MHSYGPQGNINGACEEQFSSCLNVDQTLRTGEIVLTTRLRQLLEGDELALLTVLREVALSYRTRRRNAGGVGCSSFSRGSWRCSMMTGRQARTSGSR